MLKERQAAGVMYRHFHNAGLCIYSDWLIFINLYSSMCESVRLDSLNTWSLCFRAIARGLLNIKREAAERAAKKILSYRLENNLPFDDGQLGAVFMPTFENKPERLNLKFHWLPEKQAYQLLNNDPFESTVDNC